MKIIPLPSETRIQSGFTHKVMMTYLDFAAAALTQAVTIFPDGPTPQLQAGTGVLMVALNLTQAFAGPGVTAATLQIGDGANAARYLAAAATDLLTLTAAATKNFVIGLPTSSPYAYANNDVTNTNAKLIATITNVGANTNVLTQGTLEIYLKTSDLWRLPLVVEPGPV